MLTVDVLTPLADRKEGGQVQLMCKATNFDSQHTILEWRKDGTPFRRGEDTATADPRHMFDSVRILDTVTQELTITNLQTDDTGEYVCNVIDSRATGPSTILATDRVDLSVLYFPRQSFPACSPAGAISVPTGTRLTLRCSSVEGNPKVEMVLLQGGHFIHRYTWSSSVINDTVLMSLDLTAGVADDGVVFVCMISSRVDFPGATRSCFLGPINVTEAREPTTDYTPTTHFSVSSSSTAAIMDAVIGGTTSFPPILTVVLICRRKLGICHIKRLSSNCTTGQNLTDIVLAKPEASQPSFYENVGLQINDDGVMNNEQGIYGSGGDIEVDSTSFLPVRSGSCHTTPS